jgi:hypothetical protein
MFPETQSSFSSIERCTSGPSQHGCGGPTFTLLQMKLYTEQDSRLVPSQPETNILLASGLSRYNGWPRKPPIFGQQFMLLHHGIGNNEYVVKHLAYNFYDSALRLDARF